MKQNGNLPDNRLTEELLKQVLNSSELRRYKVALRFGDKSTLKQLNELAKIKLAGAAKTEKGEVSSTPPPEIKPKPARKPANKTKLD